MMNVPAPLGTVTFLLLFLLFVVWIGVAMAGA